jgi:Tol biopolymer transport system component
MPRGKWLRLVVVLSIATALVLPADAHAAFPGGNNPNIVYTKNSRGNAEFWRVFPDGSFPGPLTFPPTNGENAQWSPNGEMLVYDKLQLAGEFPHFDVRNIYTRNHTTDVVTRLTTSTDDDGEPTWSGDGERIAFSRWHEDGCEFEHGEPVLCFGSSRIIVMNHDGTNPTTLPAGSSCDDYPNWSPTDDRIAFSRCRTGIWLMNPDGSGQAQITNGPDYAPDWSPDGTRLVFNRCSAQVPCRTYIVNRDGTGLIELLPYVGGDPSWSPDSTKIVYTRPTANFGETEIRTVKADGTGDARVIVVEADSPRPNPTWQPVPIGYPRPRGATPLRVSLVPAYHQCSAPNSTHGAPLAFSSCAPPAGASDYLTFGTPDVNGKRATMDGFVELKVLTGDVRLRARASNVFAGNLSDHTGSLHASMPLRITDLNNTSSPAGHAPATTQPFVFGFDLACTATADTSIGSDCSAATTVNAVLPGAIRQEDRGVWQVGQIRVMDGGPDNDGSTSAGNTVLARQGVFVP